jgi:glycosyltransferase involved in cell wall biosynthesis
MNFAFVSTVLYYPFGAPDRLWIAAATTALNEGHSVLIAVSPLVAKDARIEKLRAMGAHLHIREGFTQFNGRRARYKQFALRWLRHPRSLMAALDRFLPDYVFVNQGGTFDFLIENGLINWLLKESCPFVLICHGNSEDDQLNPQDQIEANRIITQAKKIGFVSTHNYQLAERQIGQTIANGTLLQCPLELPYDSALPWPEQKVIKFAVVGRIAMQSKGLNVLLEALAESLGDVRGWQVDFFGRGPDCQDLVALMEKLGLADRVQLCGFKSDVREIWADHHLLLMASHREGCSLSMLEALICGRPVLTTLVGGVSDWIEPDINGFICSQSDSTLLAQTLDLAWQSRDRWCLMGKAAAQIAATRLDPHPERRVLSIAAS